MKYNHKNIAQRGLLLLSLGLLSSFMGSVLLQDKLQAAAAGDLATYMAHQMTLSLLKSAFVRDHVATFNGLRLLATPETKALFKRAIIEDALLKGAATTVGDRNDDIAAVQDVLRGVNDVLGGRVSIVQSSIDSIPQTTDTHLRLTIMATFVNPADDAYVAFGQTEWDNTKSAGAEHLVDSIQSTGATGGMTELEIAGHLRAAAEHLSDPSGEKYFHPIGEPVPAEPTPTAEPPFQVEGYPE